MFVLNIVFVTCALIYTCDAGFVDTLPKCSIKDNDCMRDLYQNIIKNNPNGIPELGIENIDPYILNNITVTLMTSIKLTLINGSGKGFSKCDISSFKVDIEKGLGTAEIICDLSIKGQVEFSGRSALAQSFLGDAEVYGSAKAKVRLDQMKLSFAYGFRPQKKEDGEIYISVTRKDIKYTYDVKKASFSAENIYVGKDDISAIIVPYLNENWSMILKNFGPVFFDKAMELYITIANKFFLFVPTKQYIIEDLTPYIDN